MLHRTFLLFIIMCHAQLFAQNVITIKGQVADTSEAMQLKNATIVLSRSADSIMVKFTRADASGAFIFKDIPKDNYLLSISYPKYADYIDVINAQNDVDLGLVNMITMAVALENVIVRGSPIRMKGDTLSFLADSFKVREGDNVEELLKRLPGLQVNSKGEITAQGQSVKRVLVDGDEFFGDDPTLATRNIRADMVKEVQVFDRKSDQATFTGVDDGELEKTINLKLKDEAKNGYFGKVSAGGGLKDNYKNEVMANLFKGKRKISAYGLNSNVDRAGLDWQAESNYGGNMNQMTEFGDDGSMFIYSGGDDFGGDPRNEGLPQALTAGVHFGDKWNDNKNTLNGSYRMRQINSLGGSRTTSQFILPDTQYFNNENTDFQASRIQHRLNASYDFQLDSMQSILIRVNGGVGNTETVGTFTNESLEPSGSPVNSGTRRTTNDEQQANFGSSLLYKRKFTKRGRTLSLNLTQSYNKTNGEGFLFNENDFFKGGILIGKDTTDQLKENNILANTYSGRLSLTEGIGKKGIFEWSYQYNRQSNENERLSFDKINGDFTELNETFSNSFRFNSNTHNTGIGYKYNDKKWTAGLGGNIALSDWTQDDLLKDTTRNINFTNFLGRANAMYKIKPQTNIRFNYNANTRNPSIDQLQPLQDNNNPLFIRIGNPDLKLSFNQSFNLSFNDYKVLSGRSLYVSTNFNTVSNAFSNTETVDSIGRRVSQAINVNGNYNFNSFMYYDRRVGQKGLNVFVNGSYGFNRNKNFVNNQENINNSNNYSITAGLRKFEDKEFEFDLMMNARYNTNKASIRPDVNIRLWSMSPEFNFRSELKYDIRISSEVSYNWRQRTSVFDQNNNALLWNADITKKILKKQDLRLGIKMNDILNQNIGFNRQVTSNFVTEQNWQVVRRYWLATLVWNFSKNGKPSDGW